MAALDELLNLNQLTATPPGATSTATPGAVTAPAVASLASGAGSATPAGYAPAKAVAFNPKTLPGALAADSRYKGIIGSNPDYMAWSLQAGERADTAEANRRAAMRALAIRFGGLPSGFQDPYGDIDPETSRIAQENQVSEQQRLMRAYQDQVEANRRSLASRHMLQSGELGYSQNQLDTQKAADTYDLNNQFLDSAQGSLNDYAGLVAQLNSEQIDQIRAAAQAAYESGLYSDLAPPDGGDGPPGDTTPPAAGATPVGLNPTMGANWDPAVIQALAYGGSDPGGTIRYGKPY